MGQDNRPSEGVATGCVDAAKRRQRVHCSRGSSLIEGVPGEAFHPEPCKPNAIFAGGRWVGIQKPTWEALAWRAVARTIHSTANLIGWPLAGFLESVRRLHQGLQSFLSMRRMEARRRKASALWLRFSQSLASRRQRLSQAIVRSTIQRFGRTTKPLARSQRRTISVTRPGMATAKPS